MTRVGVEQAMRLAVEQHQAGRLAEAETIYHQILNQQPKHVDALRLLGVLAHQMGRADEAVDLLRRAIAVQPDGALAHGSLGTALLGRGEPQAALAEYQEAIRLKPDYAEAYCNLGSALGKLGRFDEAIASSQRAIQLKPSFANAYNNLGFALEGAGRLDEANAALRRAIELKPDFAEAHNNLGNVLRKQERPDESIAAFREAIRANPAFAEAYNNLGNSLSSAGKLDEAIQFLRQAIERKPNYAEAYSNLSAALKDQGKLHEAMAAALRATELKPDHAQAHHNLGYLYNLAGEFDSAIAEYRIALHLEPGLAETHNTLGNSLKNTGRIDEAIACYQRATSLAPTQSHLGQNLIFSLYFVPDVDPTRIRQATLDWNERFAGSLASEIRPHTNPVDPDRRLKIGYVSPDLVATHPVGRFLLPVLEQHDHSQFEVFCYSGGRRKASELEPFRALSDTLRDLALVSDHRAAEQIRHDGIDILIDLSMHTANSRLLVFARKPAPLQVTWLAYPGSTGLTTIDYRITDPYLDPPGLGEEHYSEESLRLPHCWYCYRPPADELARVRAPASASLPEGRPLNDFGKRVAAEGHIEELARVRARATSGAITFGCLNNFSKVNFAVLACWSAVLRQTRGSRLLLYAPTGSARQMVQSAFFQAGVDPSRVRFVGYMPMADYFALYQQIDIALDPFPFAGGTTSCDALWMGVPLVTLSGHIAAGRATGMLLSNLGLAELIADSPHGYVRIAKELANDLPRLTELRASLRERMAASPLMDVPGFTRNLEAAFRRIWRKWCVTSASAGPHPRTD